MITLKWQMVIQGHEIKGGKALEIKDRGVSPEGVFVVLREPEAGLESLFLVKYAVNIGGKDYLLMHEQANPSDQLISARLLDKQRLSCMDRDRFSSLFNALTNWVESNGYADAGQLGKILGL